MEMVWLRDADGDMMPMRVEMMKAIPAGMYMYSDGGSFFGRPHLRKMNLVNDEIIPVKGAVSERVANEIQQFWHSKQAFLDNGFVWKRGILLYGPPGSGKTAAVHLVAQWAIEHDAIVLNVTDSDEAEGAIKMVRDVEPRRPLIVVMEEIDDFYENQILSVMDGTNQTDNIIYLATTNYPEHLSERLTNRPSRFDCVLLVDFPDAEERDNFFIAKHPKLTAGEREIWVRNTQGFAYSHLRELIALVECMKMPFPEAIARLQGMWNPKTSEDYKDKLKERGVDMPEKFENPLDKVVSEIINKAQNGGNAA